MAEIIENITDFAGFRKNAIIDSNMGVTIVTEQDVSSILESIKGLHGDSFDASRDFQLLARIPMKYLTDWQALDGLDTNDDTKDGARHLQRLVERDAPAFKLVKGDF